MHAGGSQGAERGHSTPRWSCTKLAGRRSLAASCGSADSVGSAGLTRLRGLESGVLASEASEGDTLGIHDRVE